VLVHPDRAGEHAGSHIARAHHLEQALDGAVLAERPVQQRQGDVNGTNLLQGRLFGSRAFPYGQLAAAGNPDKHRVGGILAELRQLAVRLLQVGEGRLIDPDPPSRPGDPNPDDVVAISVDRCQHTGRGQAGDPVLAAGTAEDHCHPGTGMAVLPMIRRLITHRNPSEHSNSNPDTTGGRSYASGRHARL